MTTDAQYDVSVVGAGPAGLAAALSAARAGASTLLLERLPDIGGNAGNAFVHTICGLYEAPRDPDESSAETKQTPRYLNPGLAPRFAEGLQRAGAALPPEQAGRVYVLPISPTGFRAYADHLCTQETSLTRVTGSELCGLSFDSSGAELAFRGGSKNLQATSRIVIDTTGDATAAALCNAETIAAPADKLQTPSFIVRLSGVESRDLAGFSRLHLTRAVSRAARQGLLVREAESVLIRPGLREGDAYLTLNLPRPPGSTYDPLDPRCVAELGEKGRGLATEIVHFLRENRPGFSDCAIAEWPARIGVRETRRVVGVTHLRADDILEGRRHDDEVARSSWPIELWDHHLGARFAHAKGAASVPLGSLVSKSQPRLGTAGRCLSATHDALGALRVIGTALATGEAVGTAGALAANQGITLSDVLAADVRSHIADSADLSLER